MNLKKILLGSVAVVVAAVSLASVPANAQITDSEFDAALAWMYDNGLTKYNTQEAFNPYANLTREQFAKFSASFAATNLCLDADESMSCDFSDLPADTSLDEYVVLACQMGLVKGSAGKYNPTANVTKAAVLSVMMRGINAAAGEAAPSETGTPWWSDAAMQAKEAGITKETDISALDRAVTRYEVALMLYRARMEDAECADTDIEDLLGDLFGDDTTTDEDDTTDDVVTESNGTAMAKLSSATPNGATVPAGVSLPVASFDFTADSEDVTLTQLVVKRIGLGDNKAIKNLTLFVNGEVVTKSRTLNSDFEATFSTFNTPVVIKKGETVKVDVIATVGDVTQANKEFAIQLVDFDTNGKETKSSLPATANTFRVGSVAGATVVVLRDGTVSNPNLGAKGAELVKVQLDNNSDEDIQITQITIKDEMRNADNFSNYELKHKGITIASVATSSDRTVTFNLSTPLTISKKQSEDLRVFADVIKGAGDQSKFTIDTETYLQGKGTQYGYGIAVNVADYNTPNVPQTITILAGEITFTENALPARKIRQNQKDVVLADYNLIVNAGKDLTLEDVNFVLNSTNGALSTGFWADVFEDVEMEVWINGSKKTFDLTASANSASIATYKDTQMAIALPATAKIQIRLVGDTKTTINAVNSWRKFAVTLNIASDVKLIENSDDRVVSDKTPSTITSNTIEIVNSTFQVTRLNRGNVSAVRWSTNIDAIAFQVKADDVSDIFVTDIKVQWNIAGSGVFASSGVSAVKLWVSDTEGTGGWTLLETQGGTKIVAGVLSFDKFADVKVMKGGTKNFLVTVDIVNDINLAGRTIEVFVPALGIVANDDNNRKLTDQPGLSTNPGRTITITSVGTIAAIIDNANTNTPRAKNVVAGTTSDYVSTFRLTAQNEAVIVEDFRINVVGGTNFNEAVQTVEIYNAAGQKIASQSVTSTPVVFDNANLKVALGSNDFFVKLVTNSIGQNYDGLVMSDASLSFEALVARGEQSGVDTNLPITSGSNNVQIIPVHISLVKITGGAGALTNGSNELWVIEITANTWGNTKLDGSVLDLVLSNLKIDFWSTKASSGTITRLDISPADPICDVAVGGVVNFASCTSGVANIKSAQTARYRVDAIFSWVVTNDSSQLSIANLAGGDLSYTSNEVGYSFTVTDLRLGDPDAKGTKKVAN